MKKHQHFIYSLKPGFLILTYKNINKLIAITAIPATRP